MPIIKCNGGLTVSVQASGFHYCTPRNDSGPWTHYELGFPSSRKNLTAIREYAEDPKDLTGTVYPYVPKLKVKQLIRDNGGLASGKNINSIIFSIIS